jgi:hypothetical protein
VSGDRELLEKAARAAGLVAHDVSSRGLWVYPVDSELNWDGEYPIFDWNPLADDGDALRLAVKLNLWVNVYSPSQSTPQFTNVISNEPAQFFDIYEEHGDDACAATRRAIVRAAAALAAATPSSDGRKA